MDRFAVTEDQEMTAFIEGFADSKVPEPSSQAGDREASQERQSQYGTGCLLPELHAW